jgi:hypothetical protein
VQPLAVHQIKRDNPLNASAMTGLPQFNRDRTTVTRIRHPIQNQPVRLSANPPRPPRRSDDGQAILEHPR